MNINVKIRKKIPEFSAASNILKKMWYIYTMEYYSAIKKQWNNDICSNMDGTSGSHADWSKSERERQIPYDIAYIWNLRYSTNEPFHRKEKIMDLENRLVVAKGEGEGVGWLGSLGWIDTNYYLWNGLAMRSFCVALGTMSRHLWWSMVMREKKVIHVRVTGSPCSTVEKRQNTVTQL